MSLIVPNKGSNAIQFSPLNPQQTNFTSFLIIIPLQTMYPFIWIIPHGSINIKNIINFLKSFSIFGVYLHYSVHCYHVFYFEFVILNFSKNSKNYKKVVKFALAQIFPIFMVRKWHNFLKSKNTNWYKYYVCTNILIPHNMKSKSVHDFF